VSLEIRPAVEPEEVRAALALRHEVFVNEQGVPVEEELDEHDETALHLVAVDDGIIVGTCRLIEADQDAVRLGRMAVSQAVRRQGVAAGLLREAEHHARETGARRIVLHAQLSAQSVYERDGYVAHGDIFMDAGIEHIAMEKTLA
jgi:predicted GNAT family N-acyltransferase